jgi:hypothetical protein
MGQTPHPAGTTNPTERDKTMFQRYGNSFKIGSQITSRDGTPLDNDQLRRAAPSIFATEAHASRSNRFAPVATVDVLEGLRREGFEPFSAMQAKTRDETRQDFTKHLVRLRHRGIQNQAGQSFEIVLVNANDGTAAYQMLPGFFRMVCANGLIAGDSFEGVKVRHSGNAIGDVIEGAYRVLNDAPRVADQVDAFRAITLNRDERQAFAEAAHVIRFPDHYAEGDDRTETPIRPDQLLLPRRYDDKAPDLWTTFNVAQENVIRGGLSAMGRNAAGQRRRSTTREVNGIDQNRSLNRALWTLTEAMARLKAA